MNFIERIFGFSPDAGSGLTEALLFLIPIACAAIMTFLRVKERRRAEPSS
jgi:hypothetical protein